MADIDTKSIYSQLGLTQSSQAEAKPNDKLGQAEFLELMTAQLKFQDPLQPMENGEFLAQMAQFGTVSGINELNTSFSSLSDSFQSNQALQASTLVGQKVMVPSSAGFLKEDGNMSISVDLEQAASQVIITIKNSAGVLVHREKLGVQQAGLVDFEWDGLDPNGNRMSAGKYQIAAELQQGTQVIAGKTLTVVDVESVTIGIGGKDFTLSVSGLGDVELSQVRKIL